MKKLLLAVLLFCSARANADIAQIMDCSAVGTTATLELLTRGHVLLMLTGSLTGGCNVVPEASLDDGATWFLVALRREEPTAVDLVTSLTSANTALSKIWRFINPGYNMFRVRMSAIGTPGSVTFTLTANESDSTDLKPTIQLHPNAFRCTMTSTATTLTQINGCSGYLSGNLTPASGRVRITGLQWSSSIISTTANFMLFRAGSGSNCGTGTVDAWRGFAAPAFASNYIPISESAPIELPLGNSFCFIHAGAGTRFINVQGYVAP